MFPSAYNCASCRSNIFSICKLDALVLKNKKAESEIFDISNKWNIFSKWKLDRKFRPPFTIDNHFYFYRVSVRWLSQYQYWEITIQNSNKTTEKEIYLKNKRKSLHYLPSFYNSQVFYFLEYCQKMVKIFSLRGLLIKL